MTLSGKRVVVGVSGSIAAYKAVLVVRLLLAAGAEVEVIMTRSAHEFVGAATFSGLTGNPVHGDAFNPEVGGELHVELAAQADLLLIVPATADLLARLAAGRADDLLTATALCAAGPIVVAPAMHPSMWSHPATTRNVAQLATDARATLVGPVPGVVASGDVGFGRLAEPDAIVAAAVRALTPRDLAGRRVVISAGPTVEDVDPVRFIGNRSSGKMGFALAARAVARGALVTLVTGPVSLATPGGVTRVDVRGALDMQRALHAALGADLAGADALIKSAAVGDFRPAQVAEAKLARGEQGLQLNLVQNPDLLAEVGARRTGRLPVLVGFAVETGDDEHIVARARDKLRKKRVDLVVANHASDAFGRDDNRATFVTEGGATPWPVQDKHQLADRILDWVVERLAAP